jgi:transcriptional regulator with XRE-family HTH domain
MTQLEQMDLLKAKCTETSQAAVARRLGMSASTINQVLKGTYPGNPTEKILLQVEEIFGQTTIDCPVVGEITLGKCAEHRRRPFAATNPMRVQLYRACQTCGGKP